MIIFLNKILMHRVICKKTFLVHNMLSVEVSVFKYWGSEELFRWACSMMSYFPSPLPSVFIELESAEGDLFLWKKILVTTLLPRTVCGLSLWPIIKDP